MVPEATEFAAPALGVPVPPLVGFPLRNDHQVPDARADLVIAAGAPVGLLSSDVADVEPRHERPQRRVRSRRWRVRLREERRVAPVLARHG
jgi:hypothetical protein